MYHSALRPTRRDGGTGSHNPAVPAGGVNFVQSANGATRPYRFQSLFVVRPDSPVSPWRQTTYPPTIASPAAREAAARSALALVGRPCANTSQSGTIASRIVPTPRTVTARPRQTPARAAQATGPAAPRIAR